MSNHIPHPMLASDVLNLSTLHYKTTVHTIAIFFSTRRIFH